MMSYHQENPDNISQEVAALVQELVDQVVEEPIGQAAEKAQSINIVSFPGELLAKIFKEISVDGSVKQVRLVCRKFHDHSTRFLVPICTVELNQASLDRLKAISEHKAVRKGVQVIRFNLAFYSQFYIDNQEEFAEYVQSMMEFKDEYLNLSQTELPQAFLDSLHHEAHSLREAAVMGGDYGFSDPLPEGVSLEVDAGLIEWYRLEFLSRAYEQYHALVTSQNHLLGNGRFVQAVVSAARQISALRGVEFVDDLGPINFLNGHSIDHILYDAILRPRRFCGPDPDLQPQGAPVDLMWKLPVALYEAGICLRNFEIFTSIPCYGYPLLGPGNQQDVNEFKQAVKGLESLTFTPEQPRRFNYFARTEENAFEVVRDLLHAILSAAMGKSSFRWSLNLSCFGKEDFNGVGAEDIGADVDKAIAEGFGETCDEGSTEESEEDDDEAMAEESEEQDNESMAEESEEDDDEAILGEPSDDVGNTELAWY